MQVVAPSAEVASPWQPGLAGMHRFGNLGHVLADTVPNTRRYFVVRGYLDNRGHWFYPSPVRLTGPNPFHMEELGIDLSQHRVLGGIGIMTPGYLRSLGLRRLRPQNTGTSGGELTYYLDAVNGDTHMVNNCMALSFNWDSSRETTSNAVAEDCGSYGTIGWGWYRIDGSVSLAAWPEGSNQASQATFDKNSEYHHQNSNGNTWDCEADYNAISAIGHYTGSITNDTSTYVPTLWSPDGTWPDCPYNFYTVINTTW